MGYSELSHWLTGSSIVKLIHQNPPTELESFPSPADHPPSTMGSGEVIVCLYCSFLIVQTLSSQLPSHRNSEEQPILRPPMYPK